MTNWTMDQWITFAGFTVAGLAGLTLICLAISHIRARRSEHAEVERLMASWRATPSHTIAMIALPAGPMRLPLHDCDPYPPLDADVIEHVAPGAGSLATLREVGEGCLTAAEPRVDPEVAAWFAEVFDPMFDEFRTAMEPHMRKVRLWELRGQAGYGGSASARAELDRWRINTPTGEYALVTV